MDCNKGVVSSCSCRLPAVDADRPLLLLVETSLVEGMDAHLSEPPTIASFSVSITVDFGLVATGEKHRAPLTTLLVR